MLLGLALLFVGAVLFLNGLWLLGRIGDREIAVINIFVGSITLLVALYSAFIVGDAASIRAGALTLLFSFTYFWVAFNRYNGADGRGLGWFSFFVSVTLVPVTIGAFADTGSALGVWLALCWAGWTFLWFLFFLLLAVQKPILRFTGQVTVITGILSGWLPGYLILEGILV